MHLTHLINDIRLRIAERDQLLHLGWIKWPLNVLNIVVLGHWKERALLTSTDLLVVTSITSWFTFALLVSKACQALLNFNTLGFLKLILLLERIVCNDLVIDTIIQLSIVIELVLSVNFPTLLAKPEHLLLDLHEFINLASNLTESYRTLLTHSGVEGRQDYRFWLLILERAILWLEVVLRETINRLFVLVTVVATSIVVGVLLLDHFALLIVEKLYWRVHWA